METQQLRSRALENSTERWWEVQGVENHHSAAALLQTESLGGRFQHSVYELFSEMEEKDGHLYAVTQTRLNGLLGLPQRIVPSGEEDESAAEAAGFVSRLIDAIPRYNEMQRALLDGLLKGFAVVELIWDYNSDNQLTVVDWQAHPQEWFSFSDEGKLLLHSPPFKASPSGPTTPSQNLGRGVGHHGRVYTAPERKFIVLRFGADRRNPYGRGLCQRAYWLYWFKKNALKFWAIFNEKYGSPTAVARYGPGTTEEDRRDLTELLQALQTDSGVVLPESIQLEFLDAARSGRGDSYREFLDWCNDEMSKVVLGGTLTSGEGRRSGSLALGSIHELVRRDYMESDAALLAGTLNETLIRWLCEVNLGNHVPLPQLHLETDQPDDLLRRIDIDQRLLDVGVSLPKSYFYRRYGRPMPTVDEEQLRYDDSNFFKYHLQFGILTINEVRERLGLQPVPWGNKRAGQLDDGAIDNEDSGEDSGRSPN